MNRLSFMQMASFIETDETMYAGAGCQKSIDTCVVRFEEQTFFHAEDMGGPYIDDAPVAYHGHFPAFIIGDDPFDALYYFLAECLQILYAVISGFHIAEELHCLKIRRPQQGQGVVFSILDHGRPGIPEHFLYGVFFGQAVSTEYRYGFAGHLKSRAGG